MENFRIVKDLLFLDIETATIAPDFDSLDERLKSLWLKKASFLRNDEDYSLEDLFFRRAGVFAEFAKIITIAIGYFNKNENGDLAIRVKSLASEDERDILHDFKQIVESKFDARFLTLCAHNGKEFDFPFICRRFLVNGIGIPMVLDISGKKPWEGLPMPSNAAARIFQLLLFARGSSVGKSSAAPSVPMVATAALATRQLLSLV